MMMPMFLVYNKLSTILKYILCMQYQDVLHDANDVHDAYVDASFELLLTLYVFEAGVPIWGLLPFI